MVRGQGVQVENRVYFLEKFIYVNKNRVKVKPVNNLTDVSDEIIKLFEEKRLKYSKS